MKKYVLIVLLFLLVGCKNNPPPGEVDPSTNEIDEMLVKKITGTWFENRRKYEISYDETYLIFDEKKLVIKSASNDNVLAHLSDDDKFSYDFNLENKQLTVWPSYQIEYDPKNPSTGGDLAPIYLERKSAIGIAEIYGSWQSTEADYPVEIMIKPTFDEKTILLLEKSSPTQNEYSKTELTLLEKTDTLFSFLTKDKSLEYRISFLEDGNMLIVPSAYSTDNDSTPNVGRPYNLTKLN